MGNNLKSVLLAVVLLGAVGAPAQRYTFKQYGEWQGLGNPDVSAIAQDRAGFLWVGTQNGVYRYNGSHFQQYGLNQGLTNPTVLTLLIDSLNVVWVGTGSAFFYLDQGRFHELTVDGRSIEQEGSSNSASLPSGEVVMSTKGSGLYSAYRRDGVWMAEPFSARHTGYNQSLHINGIFSDGGDHLWMGCGPAICEYSSAQVRFYGPQDGVPGDVYLAFARDTTGNVWARGKAHMVRLVQGSTRFRNYPEVCAAKACDTNAAMFGRDKEDRLLTPLNGGLARWDGARWERFGHAQGLTDVAVSQVFVDREGVLWIAAAPGTGLWKWMGYDEWEHWDIGQGMKDPVIFGIQQDHQGRLWTVSQGLVMRSDRLRRNFERFVPLDGRPLHDAESVALAFDGTMWLAGKSGVLWHVWPESRKVERSSVPRGNYQILSDSQNRIWIASGGGLFVEEKIGKLWQLREEGAALFHGHVVRAVAEGPDHTIWAGSNRGLYHQTNGSWNRVPIDQATLGRSISSIAVARDGMVWISGQFHGVARLWIAQDKVKIFEEVKNSPSPTDMVVSITTDARDRVWVGTDRGLDLLESGRWRHFNTGEGMLSNDTNEKATFVDLDGSFWLGTTAGLSHLTRPERVWNTGPLTTTLTEAVWAGVPLALDGQKRLPWRIGDLTVDFAVLSFRNEDAISFRYRLVGLEDDWVATKERSVRYAKLPPGRYRFEVVSEDSGLHRTSAPASFKFEIAPPWWRTWQCFVCIVLLLAGLVVAMWRFRMRQLVATKKKLEEIVAERTRTLEEERVLLLLARDALKQQATHDSLTGLLNRRAILDSLNREWQRAAREHLSLLVVIMDLDHFKRINDTYGHPAGDTVLIQVARCLESNIREYDALGRYGGEEFLLVLTGCEEWEWSAQLNRIRESIARERFLLAGIGISVSCSFGAAGFSPGQKPVRLQDLLAAADRALYRAKANGRNRVEFESSS